MRPALRSLVQPWQARSGVLLEPLLEPSLEGTLAATSLITHNRDIFIAGTILAVPILVIYFCTRKRFKAKFDLEECIGIIVGCVGIPAGLKIMYYSFFAADLKELDADRLPVFIGGYALTWIAVRGIFRIFKP